MALAPELTIKGIEQARITLLALGAEAESDELAAYRYAEFKQEDGSFVWGGIISEVAPCKDGAKTKQRIHYARTVGQLEVVRTWNDQLQEKFEAQIEVNWEMDLAKSCKVEGTKTTIASPKPFADEDAWKAWTGK